ncbi:MAG: hypothetical protein IJ079_04890 [Lachnospiraceae bacterium]|nr:hypothetical protein [Lachnospiraceae bacterium]
MDHLLYFENGKVENNKKNGIMRRKQRIVSGKGKSSMRDYSRMTDEEFIKSYEEPYTHEELEDNHRIALQQLKEGNVHEFTDEYIDELMSDESV